MVLSSNNFPKVSPEEPLLNSPYGKSDRFEGRTTKMDLSINYGSVGTYKYISFIVHGLILVKRLYGVFSTVGNNTLISTCFWQVYRSAAAGSVLTLSGTNCSGVTEGASLLKTTDASAAATLLADDDGVMSEEAGVDQFQGFVVSGDSSDDTTIAFIVTEDDDTDVILTQYCDWVPLTEDASVVAGDGSLVPAV